MRRVLFTIVASAALVAFVPASAIARNHHRHHDHHRRHHHHVRHHARTHRFGHSARTHRFGHFTSSKGDQNAPSPTSGTAGTVTSFDPTTGELVITLNDGTTTETGLPAPWWSAPSCPSRAPARIAAGGHALKKRGQPREGVARGKALLDLLRMCSSRPCSRPGWPSAMTPRSRRCGRGWRARATSAPSRRWYTVIAGGETSTSDDGGGSGGQVSGSDGSPGSSDGGGSSGGDGSSEGHDGSSGSSGRDGSDG